MKEQAKSIKLDMHDTPKISDDVKITIELQPAGILTEESIEADRIAMAKAAQEAEDLKAAQQAEVQRQAEEAAHTASLLAGAPQRVIVPLVGVSMNSLEMIPSNWTILPDGDGIEAYNNATGRRFVGNHADFKQILRGK
jgi:hypothetical protein